MDIVNWDYLKKGLLVRDTLENPGDLVLVAANTTYKKRGDLFQTYAIPASALGGGGATITLQTNGTDNSDQTLLNLRANGDSGILLEDIGGGTILISTDPTLVKKAFITSSDEVYPTAAPGGEWRDISGLSFPVITGSTYTFTFNIFFTITNASPQNYGTSWSVSGSNTFLALNVFSEWPGTSATTNVISGHQAYDGALIVGTTASLATQPIAKATITGTITASSNGLIIGRSFTEGNANMTIFAGSSVEYITNV